MSETLTPPSADETVVDEGANRAVVTEAPATETTDPKPAETKSEPAKEEPKREPWFQERIRQQAAKLADANRAREALEREIAELRVKPEAETPPTGKLSTQADVEAAAERLMQQRSFTESCNRVAEQGKAAFTDFGDAVQNFNMLGGLQDKPHFLEAVTELPNGHQVFYHLGKNPDEAIRVLAMPATKMAVHLARLSDTLAQPAKVSTAPRPLTPVEGSAASEGNLYDAKLSTEAYLKMRQKQWADQKKQ